MALFKCNSCNQEYEDYYPPDDICTKCNKGHIRIITFQEENTMTAIKPTIRIMTPEDTRTTQLMNAGSVIELEGTTIPISAGRSDQVHVFSESTVLYVLSTNIKLGYMGLEVFDAASGEEYNTIFINYEWELEEYLGKEWEQMEPVTIIRILTNFLY